MESFSLSRLDTGLGQIRAEGNWDPVDALVELETLELMGTDGWIDVTFWLSEQAHEAQVAEIVQAVQDHLAA